MATVLAGRFDRKGRETLADVLGAEIRSYHGVLLVNLEGAAKLLWYDRGVYLGEDKRAVRAAMREVDQRTVGQPFRIDTSAGPLFADYPLWRFAGRSGRGLGGKDAPRKERPTWDGDWREEDGGKGAA